MIWVIIVLIFLILILSSPYIDIYRDFEDKLHIIIWYTNHNNERKHFNLIGGQ